MRELIQVWESGRLTLPEKEIIVRRKIEDMERKIADLEQMKTYLLAKLPLLNIEDTIKLAQYAPSHIP